eukprot:snap_masked-scaffold_103-processed-gene-0.8-mRNA-1 protein AED:1.00 eAED:1.00 QI:0/0/0/0/1/1/2/0/68
MFLFENANFLFEQSKLTGFADASVKKDKWINPKPSSEDWFRACEKELIKLIDLGKMVLVPKTEGSGGK